MNIVKEFLDHGLTAFISVVIQQSMRTNIHTVLLIVACSGVRLETFNCSLILDSFFSFRTREKIRQKPF